MGELLEFAVEARNCRSFSPLQDLMVASLQALGIERLSYHHMPPRGAFDRRSFIEVTAVGYPQSWLQRYKDRQYWEIDPIPRRALNSSRPFTWDDIMAQTDLTLSEKAFLAELEEADLGNGLAVPVFGPHARNGYVGLGCGKEHCGFSDEEIVRFQFMCQAGHLRYCELIGATLPQQLGLSDREREILSWMAKGKSNAVMADILGLSPNTVDTYARRIFKKLNVADRVTATLRGVALGLID